MCVLRITLKVLWIKLRFPVVGGKHLFYCANMLALYYNISTEFGSASQIYLKKTEKKGADRVGEDDKKEIKANYI